MSFISGHFKVVSLHLSDQLSQMLTCLQDAVRAGTGNVMCSYNRLNNSQACANSKILNGLLKTELGYNGFIVTDWYAQKSGVASALAGLDMVMPSK